MARAAKPRQKADLPDPETLSSLMDDPAIATNMHELVKLSLAECVTQLRDGDTSTKSNIMRMVMPIVTRAMAPEVTTQDAELDEMRAAFMGLVAEVKGE